VGYESALFVLKIPAIKILGKTRHFRAKMGHGFAIIMKNIPFIESFREPSPPYRKKLSVTYGVIDIKNSTVQGMRISFHYSRRYFFVRLSTRFCHVFLPQKNVVSRAFPPWTPGLSVKSR
jgi:hypothetical protein